MESSPAFATPLLDIGPVLTTPDVTSTPKSTAIPPLSIQLEERNLSTLKIGDGQTRLLRIAVENDESAAQSLGSGINPTRLLDDLYDLVNRAFGSNHRPPFIGSGMKRFPNFDYMVTTLLTPGAVIWVLLRDSVDNQIVPSDFLATITLLPYDHSVMPPDVVQDPNSSWDVYVQSSKDDETELPIILKSFAVDPYLHGQGVGKWMLDMCGREALNRARSTGRSRARIAMTTMMELNQSFYLGRGWVTTRRYVHQPGYVGNSVPITAVQMEKVLDFK